MELENDVVALNELLQLYSTIGSIKVPPRSSFGFRFLLNSDGQYSVDIMRRYIDEKTNHHKGSTIFWDRRVPLKGKCFIWRVSLAKIPVATTL